MLLRSIFSSLVVALMVSVASSAFANETFPARARLFAGIMEFNNDAANEVFESENLKKIDMIPHFGAEITFPLGGPLEGGMRYFKRVGAAFENGSDSFTENNAAIGQDVVLLVGRMEVANFGMTRFDVFAGVGGANTAFEIKTPGQTGELKKSNADSAWLASFAGSYGASASVGHKWIYLTLEIGIEHNKVDSFVRSGTVSSSLSEFDFTGPYALIGLTIDGVTASKK